MTDEVHIPSFRRQPISEIVAAENDPVPEPVPEPEPEATEPESAPEAEPLPEEPPLVGASDEPWAHEQDEDDDAHERANDEQTAELARELNGYEPEHVTITVVHAPVSPRVPVLVNGRMYEIEIGKPTRVPRKVVSALVSASISFQVNE